MEYLVLECKIDCPSCGLPVPLNGLWDIAHCDSCQKDIEIPHDYWVDMLRDCLNELKEFADGEGRNSTIFGTFHTALLYGELKPRCPDDKTDLEMDKATTLPAKLFCTQCAKPFQVIAPPDWLASALPAVKLIVGMDLESSTVSPKPEVEGLVVFVCPQCGGTLQVDGKDRMLNCQYCHSNVYLPDDLWRRLHPVKTVQRWYVGADESKLPMEEPDEEEEDDSSK